MTREDQLFINHLQDCGMVSQNKGYTVFSDFLNLNQQTIFYDNSALFTGIEFELYGGYDDAERRMIRFGRPLDQEETYPIVCLQIAPANAKFSDHLTHRDFLGAVLNLGIDRNKTGDILIRENIGYMFCKDTIADFIVSNLEKIKHTKVRIKICETPDFTDSQNFKTRQGTVSSVRIDSLISLAFKMSRGTAAKYVSQGLVYVNGRLIMSNSFVPKDGDIISVRTLGRFKLELTQQKSKKDKFIVNTHMYI